MPLVNVALVNVALEEGFTGGPVAVRINGAEVFRKEDVKTRLQIGLAASFEKEVEPGPVRLEVELPEKELEKTFDLDVSGTVYAGISVQDGDLVIRTSAEPFGYL